MADPNIVGTPNDIIWGTNGTYAVGLIKSCRKQNGGDKREIRDNNGKVVVVVYFNDNGEVELVMLAQVSIDLPARGTPITIAGLACLTESAEENWRNEQEKEVTLKAHRYPYVVVG
jgi:hypothetical protein